MKRKNLNISNLTNKKTKFQEYESDEEDNNNKTNNRIDTYNNLQILNSNLLCHECNDINKEISFSDDDTLCIHNEQIENDIKLNDTIKEKICPVCYENIQDKNYIVTKCNHVFCNDCLFQSLKVNSTCPICREDIFNFKLKEINNEDVLTLESNVKRLKCDVSHKLTHQLMRAVTYSMEHNTCDCVNDETKKILSTYLSCHNVRSNIHKLFINSIMQAFSIISYSSYDNLYTWLKNN